MNKRIKYDSGLSFSKPLDRELQSSLDRVQKYRKASLIIIDGGVGEGKTTLAVHGADFMNQAMKIANNVNGGMIDFEDQIAMGGMDFIKKLKICYQKKLPVLIYDEAGDFNSRGAITRFNSMLNRVFETYRAFKIVIIICLPDFSVLDKTLFRKGIVRFLIHCYSRNMDYGNYKVYSLWRLFYLLEKQKKLVVKTDAFKYVVPNFYGHFLDLDPTRSKLLDEFSTKNKLDILGQLNIDDETKGLYLYKDLGKLLGCSITFLRRAIKKLEIKPRKIFNKKYYFDEKALEKIGSYIDNNKVILPSIVNNG